MRSLLLLLEWILSPFLRKGESHAERVRKMLLLPIVVLSIIGTLLAIAYLHVVTLIMAPITIAACASILLFVYRTKTLSTKNAEVTITLLLVLIVFVGDLKAYSRLDIWTLSVPVMDLALLCDCRAGVTFALRNVTAVYIIWITLESSLLLVLDSLPQISAVPKPTADCALPLGNTFFQVFVRLGAFLGDFFVTYHFAKSMQAEKQRVEEAVYLAQRVAESLGRFDLDMAEAALASDGEDEDRLRKALHRLLENLRSYRPYLPEAVFEMGSESEVGPSSPSVRTAPSGHVALVFTDIQSSTALWEWSASGMRKAMATHNTVMRGCLQRCNGYEVKTIGDAFMVAFAEVEDAVGFALAAQEVLYVSEWTEELLGHPLCQPVKGTWNGLRVRMGVHWGEVDMQVNPVTGRADYFGPTVNIAARAEGAARGGTVAVTEEVYVRATGALGGAVVRDLGVLPLRGVSHPVHLYQVAPLALADRQEDEVLPKTPSSPATSSLLTSVLGERRLVRGTAFHKSCGTVAHMRIDYRFLTGCVEWQINDVISAAVDSVDRASGMLLTVGSSSVVAGWNIGRQPVYGHASQAVLAAGLMYASLSGLPAQGHVAMGIMTGAILHGSVGTETQRFMLAIGQSLELAGELATGSSMLGAFALLGAMPGQSCLADDPSAGGLTRPVDVCQLESGRCIVYQLRSMPRRLTRGRWTCCGRKLGRTVW